MQKLQRRKNSVNSILIVSASIVLDKCGHCITGELIHAG